MNSLKQLKEDKLKLQRELADSCRHVVELQFSYKELHEKYVSQNVAFANFLIKVNDVKTMEDAFAKVKTLSENPTQLELPLIKHENELF